MKPYLRISYIVVLCLFTDLPTRANDNYSPVGKRDPFKASHRQIEKKTREPGPLEEYDLDRLKLAAVIASTSKPLGLVEAPNGIQYVVVQGSMIGRNRGRIIKIVRDRIIVSELYFDPISKKTTKHIKHLYVKKALQTKNTKKAHPWATLWRYSKSNK
ncbi:MAG: pilus assembly protein PilP [Deltaproteobacteria bacterium]|nr:pilus assembly protein PilP [Deltaproteobacteria bacterium]